MSDRFRRLDPLFQRPPRVRISYEVELYGSPTTLELPFVMGVMAGLGGASDTPEAIKVVADRRFVEVDAGRFPRFMEALSPRVKADVKNTLSQAEGEEDLAIDVSFNSMGDFAPDKIAEQIPALAKLLAIRRQLEELLGFMVGRPDAKERIAELLSDKPLLRQIAEAWAEMAEPEMDTGAGTAERGSQAVDLGEYMDLLQKEFRVRYDDCERLRALVHNLAIARQARAATPAVSPDAVTMIESMIDDIDKTLTEQMNHVLHVREIREIEGAWRGLWYLVSNTETDQRLKIRVMNITKSELAETLEEYEGQMRDQSPIYHRLYDDEYSTISGQPYGCLIGDYEFSNHPKDVGLLRNLAGICASAHTPFIAAASPRLFRMDSWQELPNPIDLAQIVSNPAYASWQSLRESDESRYVGLTMPRVLARKPYGAETAPAVGFIFEENICSADEDYIWISSAYCMGVIINRSFKLYGWCARISGYETGGAIENLPFFQKPDDSWRQEAVCPTEVNITERRVGELASVGLCALVHRKSTDFAAFISVPSLQDDETRANRLVDSDAQTSQRLTSNLSFLLVACRLCQILRCMIRDNFGSIGGAGEAESKINRWLNEYIEPNRLANTVARARRPLIGGSVKLEEDSRLEVLVLPYYHLEYLYDAIPVGAAFYLDGIPQQSR